MSESAYGKSRVRAGIGAVLLGRAATGGIAFGALLLVVQLLSVRDYGTYVAVVATAELGMAAATVGLDWLAARWIPESVVRGGRLEVRRLVTLLAGLQLGLLCSVAAVLYSFAETVGEFVGLRGGQDLLRLYAGVLVVEGLGRVFRDQVLTALLEQRSAQLSQVARVATYGGGLLAVWLGAGTADPLTVGVIDGVGAVVGLVVSGVFLSRALSRLPKRPVGATDSSLRDSATWLRSAGSMYVTYIAGLSYGPQVLVLLVSRFIGGDAVAEFGFVRNLVELVRRWLPGELLWGVIRPALIARYVATNDARRLSRQATAVFKVNLLVLGVLLSLSLGVGSEVVGLLSGGKFSDSGIYLVVLLLAVMSGSYRRTAELTSNAVGRPGVCARASIVVVPVPFVGAGALMGGLGVVGLIASVVLGELAFSALVMWLLRRRGLDVASSLGDLAWALAPWIVLVLAMGLTGPWQLPLEVRLFGGLTLVGVLGALALCGQVFSHDERALFGVITGWRQERQFVCRARAPRQG